MNFHEIHWLARRCDSAILLQGKTIAEIDVEESKLFPSVARYGLDLWAASMTLL